MKRPELRITITVKKVISQKKMSKHIDFMMFRCIFELFFYFFFVKKNFFNSLNWKGISFIAEMLCENNLGKYERIK